MGIIHSDPAIEAGICLATSDSGLIVNTNSIGEYLLTFVFGNGQKMVFVFSPSTKKVYVDVRTTSGFLGRKVVATWE